MLTIALSLSLLRGWWQPGAGGGSSPRAREVGAAEQGKEAQLDASRQVLIVLRDATAADHASVLQSRHRVLTMVRPRLMILEVDPRTVAELDRDAAIAGVYERDVPADVLAGLRPDERLFVDGWLLQRTAESKPRVGDGLSWDAPGFQPPDPPPKTRN